MGTYQDEEWEDDDWEEGEAYCDWCGEEVSHGIEGCPGEWHCLYPGNCRALNYRHHNSECCTAEMQAAYDRLYWWFAFWERHPRLFACRTFLKTLGTRWQGRTPSRSIDEDVPF